MSRPKLGPNFRDVGAIARFEVARHLRSRHTIVAGLILVVAGAYGAYELADYADRVAALGADLGPALDAVAGLVEGITGLPIAAVRGLLDAHPPVLVALFALVLGLVPLLTMVLAYDQTATDIETRHVRYLLFRSDRVSIYLGKALGAQLIVTGAIGIGLGIVGTFLGLRSGALDGVAGVVYLGRIWLTASLAAVPLVALLGLISAVAGRARRALSFTVLYWFAVSAGSGLLGLVNEDLRILRFAFPGAGRFRLLFDDGGDLLVAGAYVVGYTIVAGGLGLLWFRRRDL